MKKLTGVISSGALYLGFASHAFAASVKFCPTGTTFGNLCNLSSANIGTVFSGILTVLLIAAVAISLVYLIWGGIKWIVAGGDKGAIDQARTHVVGALIGLVIAFAAFFLINIVTSVFLGFSVTDVTFPKLF